MAEKENNNINEQQPPSPTSTPSFDEYQRQINHQNTGNFDPQDYQVPQPTSIFDQPQTQNANHSAQPHSYRPKQRQSSFKTFLKLVLTIVFIVGLAWALREFVFQAYEIPSGSMEHTIMTGDVVFAEKVSHYFGPPKRGDIITFNDPEVSGRILIKRVIATGGQTINIKNNKVYVDNVELDEPYTNGLPTKQLSNSKVKFPYTIPADEVWVMGDNRTNSQDSRYYGSIPVSSIIGHALAIYWPTDHFKVLT